jgi:fatty acid desaturase
MSDVSITSARSFRPAHSPSALIERFAAEFRVRPFIYWADLLLSAVGGWLLFGISCRIPFGTPLYAATAIGATFALLRAALFIHELAHLRRGQIPHFDTVWNAIVGIPLQMPSLMYVGSHMDHHRRSAFGTINDPEYVPIATRGRFRIALFALTGFFIPVLLVFRWGVLGPLSYVFPRLRKPVVERASTLVINTDYRRPEPRGKDAERWRRQEIGAALFFWVAVAALWLGWLPLAAAVQWFVVSSGSWFANQLRTLAAHGYEHEGGPMDGEGQLLDSINLRGWPLLTALVAPVGLRFHALHHHLPGLPYHSLGRVHRRLLAEVPADSPYRSTVRGGLLDTLQELWERAENPERQLT